MSYPIIKAQIATLNNNLLWNHNHFVNIWRIKKIVTNINNIREVISEKFVQSRICGFDTPKMEINKSQQMKDTETYSKYSFLERLHFMRAASYFSFFYYLTNAKLSSRFIKNGCYLNKGFLHWPLFTSGTICRFISFVLYTLKLNNQCRKLLLYYTGINEYVYSCTNLCTEYIKLRITKLNSYDYFNPLQDWIHDMSSLQLEVLEELVLFHPGQVSKPRDTNANV